MLQPSLGRWFDSGSKEYFPIIFTCLNRVPTNKNVMEKAQELSFEWVVVLELRKVSTNNIFLETSSHRLNQVPLNL